MNEERNYVVENKKSPILVFMVILTCLVIIGTCIYFIYNSIKIDNDNSNKEDNNVNSIKIEEDNISSEEENNINSSEVEEDNIANDIFKNKYYENGTIVYYDPEKNSLCSEEDALKNVNENGISTTIKNGCMKWYTFNDAGEIETTVNMILDHNTTSKISWGSGTADNVIAISTLLNDTATWDKKLNPRLITANEIAKITGNNSFNEFDNSDNDWFYFDTNTQETPINQENSKYSWLYDNTGECISHGCYELTDTIGYWTNSLSSKDIGLIWRVDYHGYLRLTAWTRDILGIRPVITVSKLIIS